MGLDDLPLYEDAEILKAWGLKREIVTEIVQEKERTTVVQKKLDNKMLSNNIDADAKTVHMVFEGDVDINNIAVAVDISRAATITPVDGSPGLGIIADWSKPHKYIVTAADNSFKNEWTITVSH